ncbi:MAG: hypothetical protein JWQ71_3744 [Pedosphaera sp.]|nr:hypothetical protein [Pedosphaera sp.]
MNPTMEQYFSGSPHIICVRFGLPDYEIHHVIGEVEPTVEGRHLVEKAIQNMFFKSGSRHGFVVDGKGTLESGHAIIETFFPEAVLSDLLNFFSRFPGTVPTAKPFNDVDLREYIHLGWYDQTDDVWRTFFPHTTQPFWTFFESAEEIEQIMERGRATKA